MPAAPLPAMPGAVGLGGTPSSRLKDEPATPVTDAASLKPLCRTGSTAHGAPAPQPLSLPLLGVDSTSRNIKPITTCLGFQL